MVWLGNLLTSLFNSAKRIFPIAPFWTVHLALNDKWPCWWSLNQESVNKFMLVGADLLVSNITNQEIILVSALIDKKKNIKGTIRAENFHNKVILLAPKSTITLEVRFELPPTSIKTEKQYIQDIAVVDQFKNKHWIKCIFNYTPF